MAKKDIIVKEYLKNTVHFCDFMNGVLFDGEEFLTPEKFTDLPTELQLVRKTEDGHHQPEVLHRFCDLAKRYDMGNESVIFVMENQTEVDFSMPLRVFVEDALMYNGQCRQSSGHRLCRDDRLELVITVVFYYGGQRWTAKTSMRDLIAVPDTICQLEKYVPEYSMILVTPQSVDCKKMRGGWREVFEVLRRQNHKQELEHYLNEKAEEYQALSEDTKGFLFAIVDLYEYYDKFVREGEERNMCKAIDDIRIESEKVGEDRCAKNCARLLFQNGASMELVSSSICMITQEELKRIYETVQKELSQEYPVKDKDK